MPEVKVTVKRSGEIELENSGGAAANETIKEQLEDQMLGSPDKEYQTCEAELTEETPDVIEHIDIEV